MMKIWGIVGVVVVAIALGLILVQAEGAPSIPTASINQQLNPSEAQTIQVSFTYQMYATQPVNSVLNFGTAVIYSASVGTLSLAYNQRVATSAIKVTGGDLYTLQATVSFEIPQLCTSACASYSENLTITSYATVSTWVGFWSSPTVQSSFYNNAPPAMNPNLPPQSVPINQFYFETWGMVTLFLGIALTIAFFAIQKHLYIGIAAGVLYVAFVVEVVVLGLL